MTAISQSETVLVLHTIQTTSMVQSIMSVSTTTLAPPLKLHGNTTAGRRLHTGILTNAQMLPPMTQRQKLTLAQPDLTVQSLPEGRRIPPSVLAPPAIPPTCGTMAQ